MKTINQLADQIGTHLSAPKATAFAWRRPVVFGGAYLVDNSMVDNSTDVSARERRHR